MGEKSASPLGVGVLTLFTVLLVLTLSVFAALTWSSARADLRLSKINADTVTAYYQADGKAAELYTQFSSGGQQELETYLPVTDSQQLYLHLVRDRDGVVQVLAWRTVPIPQEQGSSLDVWDGTLPTP